MRAEPRKQGDRIIVSGCDLTPYVEAHAQKTDTTFERWLKEENRLQRMAVVGSPANMSEVGRESKI